MKMNMKIVPPEGTRKRSLLALLNRYYEGLLIVMVIGVVAFGMLFITMLLY